MSSSSSETAKQWLQKRKLQAQKRQVPGSSSSNINIDEEVPTFFLYYAQNQMKSFSLYRKKMFLQGGQILLPRGALER